MRNIADEVGLLPSQAELALDIGDNEGPSLAYGQHQEPNEQRESEFKRLSAARQPGRIVQIDSDCPVRQNLADFLRDKGWSASRALTGYRFAGIIEQGHTALALQRLRRGEQAAQAVDHTIQIQLSAENHFCV